MDFIQLAKKRRSIRKYRPDPVAPEIISEIIEAARWAPSSINSQPWEFIIITDPQVREAVENCASFAGFHWPHIKQAPVLIIICASKLTPFARDDCIFAGANIMHAATDHGLGTCWIGGFSEERLKTLLGVPKGYVLPGFCTLGYPANEPSPPPRRELDAMLHYETFDGHRDILKRWKGPFEVLKRLIQIQFSREPRKNPPGDM